MLISMDVDINSDIAEFRLYVIRRIDNGNNLVLNEDKIVWKDL